MQIADYLTEEWHARSSRNPRYSKAAFARDLGVSPSQLSKILAKKVGLSLMKARSVAEKLQLNQRDSDNFLAAVAVKHGRNSQERRAGLKHLQTDAANRATCDFAEISDWYYLAILELFQCSGFLESPEWIATKLQIEVKTVKFALDKLIKLELLIRNAAGKLQVSTQRNIFGDSTPNTEIRKFHGQYLDIAKNALDQVPMAQRYFQTNIESVNANDMPKIRARIDEFLHDLRQEFSVATEKEDLAILSIQFYPLTKRPPSRSSK